MMNESKKKRRTQAERLEVTRTKLLDAAIEALLDLGYQGCRLAEVARRADMTTGALQHHFNSKSALLEAVISERLFKPAALEESFDPTAMALNERCDWLISRLWSFYEQPQHLVAWDILFNSRDDPGLLSHIASWRNQSFADMEKLICTLFTDLGLSKTQCKDLQIFLVSHMRGLGLLPMAGGMINIRRQLKMLSQMMVIYIEDAGQTN